VPIPIIAEAGELSECLAFSDMAAAAADTFMPVFLRGDEEEEDVGATGNRGGAVLPWMESVRLKEAIVVG
jgi:hypothetical protein